MQQQATAVRHAAWHSGMSSARPPAPGGTGTRAGLEGPQRHQEHPPGCRQLDLSRSHGCRRDPPSTGTVPPCQPGAGPSLPCAAVRPPLMQLSPPLHLPVGAGEGGWLRAASCEHQPCRLPRAAPRLPQPRSPRRWSRAAARAPASGRSCLGTSISVLGHIRSQGWVSRGTGRPHQECAADSEQWCTTIPRNPAEATPAPGSASTRSGGWESHFTRVPCHVPQG